MSPQCRSQPLALLSPGSHLARCPCRPTLPARARANPAGVGGSPWAPLAGIHPPNPHRWPCKAPFPGICSGHVSLGSVTFPSEHFHTLLALLALRTWSQAKIRGVASALSGGKGKEKKLAGKNGSELILAGAGCISCQGDCSAPSTGSAGGASPEKTSGISLFFPFHLSQSRDCLESFTTTQQERPPWLPAAVFNPSSGWGRAVSSWAGRTRPPSSTAPVPLSRVDRMF